MMKPERPKPVEDAPAPAAPKHADDLGPHPDCPRCGGSGIEPNAQFRCACRWEGCYGRTLAEEAGRKKRKPEDAPAAEPSRCRGTDATERLIESLRQQLAAAIAERDAAIEDTKDYIQMAKEKDAAIRRAERIQGNLTAVIEHIQQRATEITGVKHDDVSDVTHTIEALLRDAERAIRLARLCGACAVMSNPTTSPTRAELIERVEAERQKARAYLAMQPDLYATAIQPMIDLFTDVLFELDAPSPGDALRQQIEALRQDRLSTSDIGLRLQMDSWNDALNRILALLSRGESASQGEAERRAGEPAPTCATCGHSLAAHRESGLGDCFARLGSGPTWLCQCREYVPPKPVEDAPAPALNGTSYPITLPEDVQEGDIIGKPADALAAETAAPLSCEDCGLIYADFPLDTTLPDAQWERIVPGRNGGGILCASCIVKRAACVPGAVAVRARIAFAADPAENIEPSALVQSYSAVLHDCFRQGLALLDHVTALRQQLAAVTAERDAAIEDTKDYIQMAKEKDAAIQRAELAESEYNREFIVCGERGERIEQLRADLAQARSERDAAHAHACENSIEERHLREQLAQARSALEAARRLSADPFDMPAGQFCGSCGGNRSIIVSVQDGLLAERCVGCGEEELIDRWQPPPQGETTEAP